MKRDRKTPADDKICAGDLSKAEAGIVKAVKSAGHLSWYVLPFQVSQGLLL